MNQDELAKERARRPANSGTKRVDAAGALAELDQRIAQQRNEHNGTADTVAKDLARHPTGSAPGVYREPPSGQSQLSDLEKDLASKKAVSGGSARKFQPGAYSVTEEKPSTGPSTLHQLEADVASKTRAAASAPSTSTSRSLSQMEADVQAKEQARPSRSGLSELEADVTSKSVARSRPSTLRDLEDAEAKVRASGQCAPAVSRGARRELDEMEAAVAKKATERNSSFCSNLARPGATQAGADEVARLDERIAYKTGISMQQEDELKEDNSANDNTANGDDAARLAKLKQLVENPKYQEGGKAHQKFTGYEGNMDGFDGDAEGNPNKLAIAEPVKDDDDDIFIPAAIEYDPDAKPPIYKNRRFRLYGLLGGILLLTLVGGLTFGLLSGSDEAAVVDDEDEPTLAPTTLRQSLGIQDQLELVVGSDKLNDPSTPHYQAMEWIIQEDKQQLAVDAPNLVQRFLMVLFYMQTTQDSEWRSCGRKDGDDSFCLWQQLVEIWPHKHTGIPWTRWLSGDSECGWAGVSCDEFDTVRAIELCKS